MTNIDPISNEEQASWPESVLVDLPSSFDDDRGSIQPLVDMAMKSSVLIDSNSGAVRANHYHKTDWHYCYVLYGEIIYYHRPHGSKESSIKKRSNVFYYYETCYGFYKKNTIYNRKKFSSQSL